METTKMIDVSTEAFRTYHYAGGHEFSIEAPIRVHVISDDLAGDSHRVEAADSKTYRPNRGWIGISWKPKDGAAAFVA